MEDDISGRIDELTAGMSRIEEQIGIVVEILKRKFIEASSNMNPDTNYFLNGIQAGSVVKSYLLTQKGVEVPGESTMPIPDFIDNVIKFANYPKRKIELVKALYAHLDNLQKTMLSATVQEKEY